MKRVLNVGYWLGKASVSGGGTAPYAWRVLDCLLSQSDKHRIHLTILCSEDANKACRELINRHQAEAAIEIIPRAFPLTMRMFARCGAFGIRMLNLLGIPCRRPTAWSPWFQWIGSLSLDLLHVPYQGLPKRVGYELPCPVVITMHDVQELHYPEFFSPETRAARASNYYKALTSSAAVVVSFEHVKGDLIKYFQLPENKIYICPLPYQNICLQPPSDEEREAYRDKYGQWGGGLLYPAQTWEHKNHLSLLKAVQYIKEKRERAVHVVCTGKKCLPYFSVLAEYVEKNNLREQIHFTDIVSESELHWLYQHSGLVVIPTLYEAGSFPLLEAMALGAPVICSSVTSLPETIGDVRFVFDPLNADQMANLILRFMEDDNLRTENINNGKQRTIKLMEIDSMPYFMKLWEAVTSGKNVLHLQSGAGGSGPRVAGK